MRQGQVMNQEKLLCFDGVLAKGHSAVVVLDPRSLGAIVPWNLRDQPQLNLSIGLNGNVPAAGLVQTSAGISCELRFLGEPFQVHIPWGAVYCIVDEVTGKQRVWRGSIPHDGPAVAQADGLLPSKPSARRAKRGGSLRLVASGGKILEDSP
jgi:hypothetical protein